jgi:serine/threonine-protein kinase
MAPTVQPVAPPVQVELPFTGLEGPQGVAIGSGGNAHVVDARNKRVLELAAGAATQRVLPFTGLNLPHDVAADAVGNLFVPDWDRVVELASGADTRTVPLVARVIGLEGVAVDSAGNLYVTHPNHVLKLAVGSPTPTELFSGLDHPSCQPFEHEVGQRFLANADHGV